MDEIKEESQAIPINLDLSIRNNKTEEETEDGNSKYIDNKKLNTPYFRLISKVKDGSEVLKEEISHSVTRMKAARHGHSKLRNKSINVYKFHLPDKTSYMPKEKAKLMRLQSGSSYASSNRSQQRIKSNIFKTEVPQDRYSSQGRSERQRKSFTSFRKQHRRNLTTSGKVPFSDDYNPGIDILLTV